MEVVLVVLVVAVSVAALVWFHRHQSGAAAVSRQFARAKAETVASASTRAGKLVALSGVIGGDRDVAVSEATGREYVVRDLRLRPFDGASSSSTRSACQAIDFLLDDDTGKALIRTDRVSVMVERDVKAPETTLDRAPWAEEILRQTGYRNGSPATCRLSVWEGVLAPGDRVEVVGVVAMPGDQAVDRDAEVVIVAPEGGTVAVRRARSTTSAGSRD